MIISLGLGAVDYGTIAHLCGSTVAKELENHVPSRLVSDSREVGENDLFCALRGRVDGHLYATDAAKRGAAAILAERQTDAPIPHILVPSVRGALGDWARGVSSASGLLRIGITGSVGKTTVKDAVATMLATHYTVHATEGNYNNDLGLPFTLLSAPKETQIAVCELGVGGYGEMEPLSRILRPHISIITCIGHAHIGAFGTREGIAEEKRKILSYAQENGLLFVCAKEPLLSYLPPKGIRRTPVFPWEAKDYIARKLPDFSDDAAMNFALAYAEAVGGALSLTSSELHEGLLRILALKTHRKEEEHCGVFLWDHGYNASPESMISALALLSTRAKGRRVAVLGDMLELGEESAKYHRAVGRFASECADLLFFFGAYAKEYALGASSAPLSNKPSYRVLTGEKAEMGRVIGESLLFGDTVLFKASRALKTECLICEVKKQIH